MNWIKDNQKMTVLFIVSFLLLLNIILVATGIKTSEPVEAALVILFTLGVKEWLDGQPDNSQQ